MAVQNNYISTRPKHYFVVILLLAFVVPVVWSDSQVYKNPPYPGYFTALNSTLGNLIQQLNFYRQYISQSLHSLDSFPEVLPTPLAEFEKINEQSNASNSTLPKAKGTGTELVDLKQKLSHDESEERKVTVEPVRDPGLPEASAPNPGFAGDVRLSINSTEKESPAINSIGNEWDLKCGVFTGERTYEDLQSSWNVALGSVEDRGGYSFVCGGVVIDSKTVLTSASCLLKNNENVKTARYLNLLYKIDSTILHPDFKLGVVYNDIALVKLEKPMEVAEKSLPCLPPSAPCPNVTEKETMDIKSFTTDWLFLLKGNKLLLEPTIKSVKVVPNSKCEEMYKKYFQANRLDFERMYSRGMDSTLLCAERPNESHCQDHRGYQMVCHPTDFPHYFVTGTRTAGEHYCDFIKLPGVYTSVMHFSDWIRNNL